MRPPRLSPSLLAALLLVALGSAACKKSKADTPPEDEKACTLRQPGASCFSGADCCSNDCRDGALGRICVKPECGAVGASCSTPSDCCGGACGADFKCVDPTSCGKALGQACTQNGDCCSQSCRGTIGNKVCDNPEIACGGSGASCAAGNPACCTGLVCGAGATCAPPAGAKLCLPSADACSAHDECCSNRCVGGKCATGFCDAVGDACDSSADCCSLNCVSGTCSSTPCRQVGTACSSGADCCSGSCPFGKCEPLGGSATCRTLGEACTLGAECCSTNCAGNVCMPSSPVGSAPGDVCYRDDDCASGFCNPPLRSGEPGRCGDASGGCGLDGYPCTSDSNCCTKKCVDLTGTGATVCQPSGGCRMTGNYCDSTAACCGGTNETNPSIEGIYGVYCDGVGRNPGHAEYDTSTKDSRTCTGGQACNPPGNICGYKASQNCCYEGGGSGKAVCKPDTGGILRCFGGPVNATCPTGWDANDPDCCKPEGAVCQFRDQCCGGIPCTPDDAGVLRCANVSSCLPKGSLCQGASEPCCDGTSCRSVGEGSPVCAADGCTGTSCTSCLGNGNTCTAAADCCSAVCDGGVCASCVTEAGTCTRNDDCCSGLSCAVEDGKTSGKCTGTTTGPTCSATGQSCASAADCCSATDTCTGGVCKEPVSACSPAEGSCTTKLDCCQNDTSLECVGVDSTENLWKCGTAGTTTACFCAPVTCSGDSCTETCSLEGQSCSTQLPCCTGYCGPIGDVSGTCTSSDPAACTCKTAG